MITSTNFATPSNNHGTNNQLQSVATVPNNATAIFFNPSLSKDTGWLTLDVCREFTRNKCSRADHQCRFAHPTANVEIQNGKVTCCFDSIKGKCQRKDPPCKYLHPPQHLKEQLLQNGRNNLIYRHQQMQFVNSVLHQQQQHLLTASPAIYPVVYDANANKAYGTNQVAIAPISDAHYYTTPYIQQGLYYAPYPATQQHLQHQFLPTQDPPMYPPNDTTNNPTSGSPTAQNEKQQQSTTSQHLENQNSVTVSSEAPPTSVKDNNKMATNNNNNNTTTNNNNNKIHYYPALAYNPYGNNNSNINNINNNNNVNNNGNSDNNNNNFYSCQQMAYATIAAPGYPFPIAAAILPRY